MVSSALRSVHGPFLDIAHRVPTSCLVTRRKLTQDHSFNAKAVNVRLLDVWELFINHQLNITELLNQCAEVMQEVETFRLNSGISYLLKCSEQMIKKKIIT